MIAKQRSYRFASSALLWAIGPYILSFIYLLAKSDGLAVAKSYEVLLLLLIAQFFVLKTETGIVIKDGLFVFIAMVVGLGVNILVYDFSFDGLGYHQAAIQQMVEGWNYLNNDSNHFHQMWLDHYPKSSWLSSAFYTDLLSNIEASKIINGLLIAASFFLGKIVISMTGLNRWLTIGFSLLLAFDPINLNTFFSHTIDGQVSSLILILFYLIILQIREPNRVHLYWISMCIIYAINLKFNAAVFVAMILFSFLTYLIIQKKWQLIQQAMLPIVGSSLLALFVFGYNPYISNLKDHHHIFHPVMGGGAIDIGSDYIPKPLEDKGAFSKLLYASFSKTSFSQSFKGDISLKLPFSFSIKELKTYAGTGVMIGGFGVWFSGLLLFSSFGLLMLFWIAKHKIRKEFYWILIPLLISTLITPVNWWARFAPQFWYICPLICMYGLLVAEGKFKNYFKAFLVALIINSLSMSAYTLYQPYATMQLKDQLSALKKEKNYTVYFGQHQESIERKLKNLEINYNKTDAIPNKTALLEFKLLEVKIYDE